MTPEQGALIKKAQESLRAARLLAKDGLCDFAASRAYYAMFYVVQVFLLGVRPELVCWAARRGSRDAERWQQLLESCKAIKVATSPIT